MKRIFVFLFITLIIISPAYASSIDFSNYDNNELHDIIQTAQSELAKRLENNTLYDMNGCLIYLTGTLDTKTLVKSEMKINIAIHNNTSETIRLYSKRVYINGWQCGSYERGYLSDSIYPGTKAMDYITVDISKTDLSSWDEATELALIIDIYSKGGQYINSKENLLFTSELLRFPIVINTKKGTVSIGEQLK